MTNGRRKKVSFWATKKVRKPITVSFRRWDGSIAKFKATKIIRKPTKVSFYTKKKRYRK